MVANKYSFSDVFQEAADGSLSPLRKISVNGVTLGPGVSVQPGVAIGGVDFSKYKKFPIAGEEDGDLLVIKGYFQE